jgi:hypothetical protein
MRSRSHFFDCLLPTIILEIIKIQVTYIFNYKYRELNMTLSIKKILLQAFVIPGTVFCAATIPLAVWGSERVAIEFQEEQVFTGQLREIASPYLALATAVSIGAGLAGVATAGWQQSHQKSARVEQELSALRQALKEKEIELENLKVSDSRLAAFGLSSFLEDEVEENVHVTSQATNVTLETEMIPDNSDNGLSATATSTQIEELCNQLNKITAHVASLQQNVQTAPMVVAGNSRN